MKAMRALFYTLPITLMALLITACGGGGGSNSGKQDFDSGNTQSPWQPTTKAFDPACSNCPVVIEYSAQESAHGSSIQIKYDPSVDDEVAQWGNCVIRVMQCIEDSDDLRPCVAIPACPASCQTVYGEAGGTSADLALQFDAFEAAFTDDDAPCLPATEGQ